MHLLQIGLRVRVSLKCLRCRQIGYLSSSTHLVAKEICKRNLNNRCKEVEAAVTEFIWACKFVKIDSDIDSRSSYGVDV